MPTSLELLSEFVIELSFEDLPDSTVRAARLCILDSLACAVGGWHLPAGREMARFVLEQGGTPQASIVVSGARLPVDRATYLNAYLTNLLDFDDMLPLVGHLGATVIPPALALAEQHGSSGRELIRAVVCGYEVGARITRAGLASPARQAVVRGHPTWQIFSATAAAGVLLGLTSRQLADGLGLAALHAPVPFVGRWYDRPVNHLKNNYGWIAQGGLTAAILAARDFVGNRGILDHGAGAFWDMAGSDRWRPEELAEGLGREYHINNVAFKTFPTCWHMQSTLAAVSQIAHEAHIAPSQVERIEVASVPYIENFADYEPASTFDGQFSLPYTVSMVLHDYPPGPAWCGPALRQDDRVRTLAMKVHLDPHGWDREVLPGQTPAAVRLILQDGRSFEASFSAPPGEPARTNSEGTVIRKFRQLAAPLLGDEAAERALARILALPDGEIGPGWLPTTES